VTIAEWIAQRTRDVPPPLSAEVLAALGEDAALDAAETGRACVRAAKRMLDSLLHDRAFGRESAGSLLVADALTTYAFEHAADARMRAAELSAFAAEAARDLGTLAYGR